MVVVAGLAAGAGACGDAGGSADPPPVLDPADFVAGIDNPYLPLKPGARWVYGGEVDGAHERIEVAVTTEHKTVAGIEAVVVSDTNWVDGELAARTFDWYAQDRDGNVWYLGEATEEYEHGKVVGTEGSWEAGVDGAEPGIFMLATPRSGEHYRQRYAAGEAEDLAKVVRTGVTLGQYHDVVVVEESTPYEPGVREEKYYAPGVGKVHEAQVVGGHGGTDLVEYTPGT